MLFRFQFKMFENRKQKLKKTKTKKNTWFDTGTSNIEYTSKQQLNSSQAYNRWNSLLKEKDKANKPFKMTLNKNFEHLFSNVRIPIWLYLSIRSYTHSILTDCRLFCCCYEKAKKIKHFNRNEQENWKKSSIRKHFKTKTRFE